MLRAKVSREQPRRLDFNGAVGNILVDPNAEDKDFIPRVPILEAVPESLPNFQPVLVVFPSTIEDEEPFEVLNMQVMADLTDEQPIEDIIDEDTIEEDEQEQTTVTNEESDAQ